MRDTHMSCTLYSPQVPCKEPRRVRGVKGHRGHTYTRFSAGYRRVVLSTSRNNRRWKETDRNIIVLEDHFSWKWSVYKLKGKKDVSREKRVQIRNGKRTLFRATRRMFPERMKKRPLVHVRGCQRERSLAENEKKWWRQKMKGEKNLKRKKKWYGRKEKLKRADKKKAKATKLFQGFLLYHGCNKCVSVRVLNNTINW